jgi:thiol:disulfide interchange protein
MMFSERPADSPDALRAWFYPGDNFGQEFVYHKHRALELAQRTKGNVPAVAVDVDDTTIKTTPIVAITPEEKEVEVEARPAPAETPAPVAATPTPAPTATVTPTPAPVSVASKTEELPQTASSMPLIALLGGLSISLALGLKLILKLVS